MTKTASIVSWEEYARSIHALLSGLGHGINVDFRTRRLVGIGHSFGAVSMYVEIYCSTIVLITK
jgi:hypothetical protein